MSSLITIPSSYTNIETFVNSKTQLIIFDTCVYVKDKRENGNVLAVLAKKLKRFRVKPVLPKNVLYEITKITKDSNEKIIKKLTNAFNTFPIVDTNDDIKSEARLLETKYYNCHFPDSIILATAKFYGAMFVTLDRKLLQIAQFEGVDASNLSDFMKYWRIQN